MESILSERLDARLETIFARALELTAMTRAVYLGEACAGDEALRDEVVSLLAYSGAEAARFDEPVCERYAAAFEEAAPRDLLLPGQKLGDYQIERLLGRGGMGEVYRAWDEKMKREVALKVLPREFADDPRRVERFQREAYAAAALNHPGILTVYEIGQFAPDDGELHYIACELIRGETLRARMKESSLAWPEVVGIAAQIAEALAVAHAAGVIHRDIKPENAMLREADKRVKMLDFGIAKLELRMGEVVTERWGEADTGDAIDALAVNNGAHDSQTLTGLLGTLNYLAPEQARLEKKVDARADIFAFGLMLYEMLAHRHPFASSSNEQKRDWLLSERELPGLDQTSTEIPGALVALVMRATRKDREQRYKSAGEMLETLRALKPAEESQTAKASKGTRKKFRQRIANRLLNQFVVRYAADRKTRLPLAMWWTIRRNSDIKRGRLESSLMRQSFWGAMGKIFAVVLLTFAVIGVATRDEKWSETILHDGSTAGVRRAAFINQGQRIVAVGEDSKIRVWDFATRQLVKEMADHTGPIVAVAASPDGRFFATASSDKTVIVWNAQTLEPIKRLTGHRGPVKGVAFSPDGQHLASAAEGSSYDAILWRVGDWEKVRDLPLQGGDWNPLLFAPRDPRLLIGQNWIANVETGSLEKTVSERIRFSFGSGLAFSRDGARAVTAESGGEVLFVDLMRWQLLGPPHPTHRDHGRGAAFSPDGKLAATGSDDIALWNAETHELITRWECSSYVWSLAWSPDGKYLVSTHGDGSILIWDVVGRECVGDLNQHSRGVGAVAFSTDKQHVASGSEDRSIIIWNVADNRKEAVLLGHTSRINALAFVPNSTWLAAIDQSGELICWDWPSGRVVWRKPLQGQIGLAVSPNGHLIATEYGVDDSATGQPVYEYSRQPTVKTRIALLAFSGDGRRLAGTGQHQLYLFDTQTWQLLDQRESGDDTSISLSYDGRSLVTGGITGAINVWQTEPLRRMELKQWPGSHKGRVKQVAFAPDGQRIVSVGDDKQVKLWDAHTGAWLRNLGEHSSGVLSVAFSNDGERIVTGGHDKSVRVYTRYLTWLGGRQWDEGWVRRATDPLRRWFTFRN